MDPKLVLEIRIDVGTRTELEARVRDEPANRGAAEWTPEAVAQADRVAVAVLRELALTNVAAPEVQSRVDGSIRRYRAATGDRDWRTVVPAGRG